MIKLIEGTGDMAQYYQQTLECVIERKRDELKKESL